MFDLIPKHPLLRKPAKRLIESRRWLWFPCCGSESTCPYGGPPDCQAEPDGTVTWFTHTVNDDGSITRNNHSGDCYTVYVNSTSGGVAETGNGTSSRPFVNLNSIFSGTITKSGSGSVISGVLTPIGGLNGWEVGRLTGAKITINGTDYDVTANTTTTATLADPPEDNWYSWTLKVFDHSCIYDICTHSASPDNCEKVKVLVKGTVDYAINGQSVNFENNLILEPWGISTIPIAVSSTDPAVYSCKNVRFKQLAASLSTPSGCAAARTINICSGCYFDSCSATITPHSSTAGTFECWRANSNCVFDSCTALSTAYAAGTTVYGFYGQDDVTYRSCQSTITITITTGNAFGYGWGGVGSYTNYHDSSQANIQCTSTNPSTYTRMQATGVGGGTASTFYNCSITSTASVAATGDGDSYAYGVFNTTSSEFIDCTLTISATGGKGGAGLAYGFSTCAHGEFIGNTVNSTASTANFVGGTALAEGFSSSHYSVFENNGAITKAEGVNPTFGVLGASAKSFVNNSYSLFEDTDADADAYASSAGYFACGFYLNTCCAFVDCTTTDAICEDCGDPCPYDCDDFDNDVEWTEETPEGVLTLTPTHSILDIRETLEGVLKLEVENSAQDIRETVEGVLKLEPTHSIQDIRETLEGVLKLEVTHSIE